MSAIDQLLAQAAGPTRGGQRRTDDGLGWRQVFDREQMLALDAFRSVSAPLALPAQPALPPVVGIRGGVDSGRVDPTPAGPAAATDTAVVAGSTDGSRQAPQPAGLFSLPGLPTALPCPVQLALAARMPRTMPGPDAGLAAGTSAVSLATPIDKWPQRKLHCTVAGDGVHLWLRDAVTTPQDPALWRWLNELQQTLTAAGMRLAGFTLNGKACLVPSLPSQRS